MPDEVTAYSEWLLATLRDSDPVPIVQQLLGRLASPASSSALRTWQMRRVAGVPAHVLRQALKMQVTGLALTVPASPI